MAIDYVSCDINEICVQVKNKPWVKCIIIMRLISWKHSRGSETTISYSPVQPYYLQYTDYSG